MPWQHHRLDVAGHSDAQVQRDDATAERSGHRAGDQLDRSVLLGGRVDRQCGVLGGAALLGSATQHVHVGRAQHAVLAQRAAGPVSVASVCGPGVCRHDWRWIVFVRAAVCVGYCGQEVSVICLWFRDFSRNSRELSFSYLDNFVFA